MAPGSFVNQFFKLLAISTELNKALVADAADANNHPTSNFYCSGHPIDHERKSFGRIEYNVTLDLADYKEYENSPDKNIKDISKTYHLKLEYDPDIQDKNDNSENTRSHSDKICEFRYVLSFDQDFKTPILSDYKVEFAYINNTLNYDGLRFFKGLGGIEIEDTNTTATSNRASTEYLNILKTVLWYLDLTLSLPKIPISSFTDNITTIENAETPIGTCPIEISDVSENSIQEEFIEYLMYSMNFEVDSDKCRKVNVDNKSNSEISCKASIKDTKIGKDDQKNVNSEIKCSERLEFGGQEFNVENAVKFFGEETFSDSNDGTTPTDRIPHCQGRNQYQYFTWAFLDFSKNFEPRYARHYLLERIAAQPKILIQNSGAAENFVLK